MSKLLIKPKPGYTEANTGSNSGSYPNTLVEAVYWDDKQITLAEALKRLQESTGGSFSDFDDSYDSSFGGDAPYELKSNKITSLSAFSTDEQYPSAKAVYDAVQSGGSELKIIDGSMWLMARKDATTTSQLTKAEAMEYLRISEDEFDLLVDSVGVYNFDVLEHFCVVRVGGSFYFPSFKQPNDFSVTCLYIPVEQDDECVIKRVDIVPHYQAGSSDSDLRYDIYGLAKAPM